MFRDTLRGNFLSAVGASDGSECDFGFGAASELVFFEVFADVFRTPFPLVTIRYGPFSKKRRGGSKEYNVNLANIPE